MWFRGRKRMISLTERERERERERKRKRKRERERGRNGSFLSLTAGSLPQEPFDASFAIITHVYNLHKWIVLEAPLGGRPFRFTGSSSGAGGTPCVTHKRERIPGFQKSVKLAHFWHLRWRMGALAWVFLLLLLYLCSQWGDPGESQKVGGDQ